jgi:DNA-binding protein YbaB
MNGQKQLGEVHIEAELFASHDLEMLQDLILVAVNDATRKVDEQLASQMGNLAGGSTSPA